MNPGAIFQALNNAGVDWMLIGGVNFLLRHEPRLTFDTDVWVRDDRSNLVRLNKALRLMGAAWGPSPESWAPIGESAGWLETQSLFCLTTPHGALDVFRTVRGLEGGYDACRARAEACTLPDGTRYLSLSDADMLACQLALEPSDRAPGRVDALRRALGLPGDAA
jgi:hypothetical protein